MVMWSGTSSAPSLISSISSWTKPLASWAKYFSVSFLGFLSYLRLATTCYGRFWHTIKFLSELRFLMQWRASASETWSVKKITLT